MARKQKRRGDTANAVTTSDADGREMYALFLEGDYPNALRAAELEYLQAVIQRIPFRMEFRVHTKPVERFEQHTERSKPVGFG